MKIPQPKDYIAIFVITITAVLIILGKGDGFTNVIALICGYYFAHRIDGIDKGV